MFQTITTDGVQTLVPSLYTQTNCSAGDNGVLYVKLHGKTMTVMKSRFYLTKFYDFPLKPINLKNFCPHSQNEVAYPRLS